MLDINVLRSFAKVDEEKLQELYTSLQFAMNKYQINTPYRVAAFLAQIAHESALFTKFCESCYYKDANRLLQLFPNDFTNVNDANNYVRNSEKCANRIYANQNGNGSEESGDGFRFRGRGAIQLTGKANYTQFAKAISKSLDETVAYCTTLAGAIEVSAWFWSTRNCNSLADVGLFGQITKKINGGYNGAEERLNLYKKIKTLMKLI